MERDIPVDVDELIDSLPLHVRNKVLSSFGQEDQVQESPLSEAQKILWVSLMVVATPFAFLCTGYGLYLAMTVILIPEAIGLLAIGNIPLTVLIIWRMGGFREENIDPEEGTEDE